jgi:urease accessory protein
MKESKTMSTNKKCLQLGLLALSVIAFFPVSAFAHTGIGSTTGFGAGFSHPFGGFDHLLAMVAVGLWAAQMGGKAIWAIPGAFLSLMIIGGVLAMSGIHLPYVEAGILASVMVMGVLIAAAFKFPVAVSALIVGVFAVFHGHAHGAEMPLAMGAVSYSLGFALATALLHCAGIAGGIVLQTINTEKVVCFAGVAIAMSGVYMAVA